MQCFYFAPALKTKRLALNLLITFANVSKQEFRLMNEQMRKSFCSGFGRLHSIRDGYDCIHPRAKLSNLSGYVLQMGRFFLLQ